jgi:hypothetical protein
MRYVVPAFLVALSLMPVGAQGQRVSTDTAVKSDNGKVVTMVGCVMIGGGTSFTLSNIASEREQGTDSGVRPRGPYALVPREGLDLGPYIHQRVELTGVVVPPATKGDRDDKIEIRETTKVDVENGRDRKSTAGTTVRVERGPMHQFLVASVKTLAPGCER